MKKESQLQTVKRRLKYVTKKGKISNRKGNQGAGSGWRATESF